MKKKRRLEFYQKWLICCISITIAAVIASYVLAAFGLETVEALSISLVNNMMTVDAIAVLGYAGQNSVRAWAADKYKYKQPSESEEE